MKYGKILLIVFLCIGFMYRFAILAQFRSTVFFNPAVMDKHDQKTFHIIAQEIVKHPVAVDGQPFYMAPLYFYFLAVLYAILGGSVFAVGIVQIFIDILCGYLLYRIGRHLSDEKTGLIALALYVFYRTAAVYSVTILSDSLILFLNIAFISAVYWSLRKPTWYRWILAGITLGLATLAKPTILAFVPLLTIGICLYPENQIIPVKIRMKFLQMLVALAVVIVACALIIAPVTLRNWFVAKQFIPICTNGPVNWQIGNSADSTGLFCYPKGPLLSPLSGAFWKLVGTKVMFFFNSYEWPQNLNVYMIQKVVPAMKFGIIHYGLVSSLGIVAFFLVSQWRRRFLFYSFAIFQILWVILFFVTDRYRLPAAACFVLLSAIVVREGFSLLQKKKVAKTAGILCGAGIWAFFFVPFPQPQIQDMHYRIFASLSRANIVNDLRERNLAKATKESDAFVSLLPDYPDSHFFRACVLVQQGNIQLAIEELKTTLAINPQHALARQFLQQLSLRGSTPDN